MRMAARGGCVREVPRAGARDARPVRAAQRAVDVRRESRGPRTTSARTARCRTGATTTPSRVAAARSAAMPSSRSREVLRHGRGRGPRPRRGSYGCLGAEVDAGPGHPPELEPAGPADLVELEIRAVAGIALVAAPHLHRGSRIAHEGGHRRGRRRRHAIRAVRASARGSASAGARLRGHVGQPSGRRP